MGGPAARIEFKCFVSAPFSIVFNSFSIGFRSFSVLLFLGSHIGLPHHRFGVSRSKSLVCILAMCYQQHHQALSQSLRTFHGLETNQQRTENDRKWCRKRLKSAPKTIENGAETKHLNSTRTARPPRAWQFESNSNAKNRWGHKLNSAKAKVGNLPHKARSMRCCAGPGC